MISSFSIKNGYKWLKYPPAQTLTCYKHQTSRETSGSLYGTLVVDSGYSFSHIVPYYKNKPVKDAIVRWDRVPTPFILMARLRSMLAK